MHIEEKMETAAALTVRTGTFLGRLASGHHSRYNKNGAETYDE